MIDGIKILTNNNPTDWQGVDGLDFRTFFNETTGEIESGKRFAVCDGLRFELVKSTTQSKLTHSFVRGSLPKFYKNGVTNAFDYSITDFARTLQVLQSKFNIDAQKSLLQGFEFGVNIEIPTECKALFVGLKSYKGNDFGVMKVDGLNVGIIQPKQQYGLKIYDKGKTNPTHNTNLLRFEIKITRMQYVRHLGIKTLADINNTEIWQKLGEMLLRAWDDVVFVPKKLDFKRMPDREQKKYLRYLDKEYWKDLHKMQRCRSKKHLAELIAEYSTDQTKDIIHELIRSKIQKLSAEKCYLLTKSTPEKYQPKKSSEMLPFNSLDKELKSNQNTHYLEGKNTGLEISKIGANIKTKKACKCTLCRRLLIHKKSGVKYCSKSCANKYHYQMKKEQRTKALKMERANLKKLVKLLPTGNIWAWVTYQVQGNTYTDHLQQSEINPTKDWIKKVQEVRAVCNDWECIITSFRAKKAIRAIQEQNKEIVIIKDK